MLLAFWSANQKRFKRFVQHCGVFLAIVSKPSFPQSISPNAIIGDMGFSVCDDVLDVLAGSQLDTTSEELLRSNRCDTCLLVVAGFPRNALADDKFWDVHFTICQAVFVVRERPACGGPEASQIGQPGLVPSSG